MFEQKETAPGVGIGSGLKALEQGGSTAILPDPLAAAHELITAGIPVFTCKPALDDRGEWDAHGGTGGTGYWIPPGWQHTRPDPSTLDGYQPGYALAAVMGHGLDVLDVDPRHDGHTSLAALDGAGMIPDVYARATTPSGGEHLLIASTGIASRDDVEPGLDVKAGHDGQGHGFVFIAPTVRASKTTGELTPYTWTDAPDAGHIATEAPHDDTGQALAAHVTAKRAATVPTTTEGDLPPGPWDDVPAALAQGRHSGVLRLAAALRGRGGWREGDAQAFMRATVWPLIDQTAGGHPFTLDEFTATIRDAFTRYPDGPSTEPIPDVTVLDDGTPDEGPNALAALMVNGGAFILDTPPGIPAIWGNDSEVIWSEGEAFILAGPPGVGKTTLTGQLVRALLGLQTHLLGYTVTPAKGKVLYLAMDRPRQIARALARHFTPDERDTLEQGLVIWPGPPPGDMAKHPNLLANLAHAAGASHVILDSLKDAALGLTEDEGGAGYNRARQTALAAGIEVAELHHTVKRGQGGNAPRSLEDLYGSRWITAGAGSVALLWGAAGDPIVELTHLKQPAEPVGPLRVIHDHTAGTSTVWHSTDPLAMVNAAGDKGLTVNELAAAIFETDKPDRNEIEKARRRLERLAKDGLIQAGEGTKPGTGGKAPTVYRAITRAITLEDSTTSITQSQSNHVSDVSAGQAITGAITPITHPSNHVSPLPYKGGGTVAAEQREEYPTCNRCAVSFDGRAEMYACEQDHRVLKDGGLNPTWEVDQ